MPGLDAQLRARIEVLDAGCGRGSALIARVERYPQSRFTGNDLSEEATAHAAEVARRAGVTDLRFEARDLTGYDERARFDLITSFDACTARRTRRVLSAASAARSGRPAST